MLAVDQEKLRIHGGFPAIEGITYSELSSRLQGIYSRIHARDYRSALSALAMMAARRPSITTERAQAMLDYVMEFVHQDLAIAKKAFNSGDYVLARTLLNKSTSATDLSLPTTCSERV